MSAKTVQTFASHSGIQVTVDRYGYLFPTEYHKKAMDEIAEGLFGWADLGSETPRTVETTPESESGVRRIVSNEMLLWMLWVLATPRRKE